LFNQSIKNSSLGDLKEKMMKKTKGSKIPSKKEGKKVCNGKKSRKNTILQRGYTTSSLKKSKRSFKRKIRYEYF
jgi:hypothetical protein